MEEPTEIEEPTVSTLTGILTGDITMDDHHKEGELSAEKIAERDEEERVAKVTVRMKGLPFEGITESDILTYFEGCEIEDEGVFIAPLTRVAYVQFKDEASKNKSLTKNKIFNGTRITIMQAKPFHRTKDIQVAACAETLSKAPFSPHSYVTKIQYLPYWSTDERVMEFFRHLDVLAIHMIWDHVGRSGSQCFVEFTNEQEQLKALRKRGLGRAMFTPFPHERLVEMLYYMNPALEDNAIVIKMSSMPLDMKERDVRVFFTGVNVSGVYFAQNCGKGTGIGFITVPDYVEAFKVWAMNGRSPAESNGDRKSVV